MRQAMKAHFTIYMKIGKEEVNLSPFISKNSVSFNSNLCSTGWKSVTDTASMTLTFNDILFLTIECSSLVHIHYS